MNNEKLVKKFPFLKYPEDEYFSEDGTWFDDFPDGWGKAFGVKLLKEIRKTLISYDIPLEDFVIEQIKEKFGGLRFYWSAKNPLSSDAFHDICNIIKKYERISEKTCIVCGKPAKYITMGYILPYCKKCVDLKKWKVHEI